MAWPLLPLYVLLALATLPLALLWGGFARLDRRYGWTKRGRWSLAFEALETQEAVSLEAAEGLPRAVVEGTLVASAGPVLVAPVVEREVIAWAVRVAKEEPKPHYAFVVGATTSVDLVDETGRAHLPPLTPQEVAACGESMEIHDVPADWVARAGPSAHGWRLSWTVGGTSARASGKVTRSGGAGYRDPLVRALSASDDGVPVILRRSAHRRRHRA